MKKVHLCCGSVYLKGYENCDYDGELIDSVNKALLAEQIIENPNETTLDNYYKYPFQVDASKRIRRSFIIDTKMSILGKWPWENKSVDEIVSIACFEHFEHKDEIPHIINEAYRVLKSSGVWKFDFPDIKGIVDTYYGKTPEGDEFTMEQIFCNRKNKVSIHCWCYSEKTIPLYFNEELWDIKFGQVVKHDYPMIGVTVTKK